METSIDKLAGAARAGDKNAENELFAKLHARFLQVTKQRIWTVSKDAEQIHQEAEDLVQEALITIWQSYGSMETVTHFLPWSFQVLRNKIGNYIHRQQSSKKMVRLSELNLEKEATASSDQRFEMAEMIDRIKMVIQKMDRKCKQILAALISGKTREDIIRLFPHTPLGTIDNKIYRCRHRLKQLAASEGLLS